MRVYVAGSLDDVATVREVQERVRAAGHTLVLDWTRGPDADLVDYADAPDCSARVAQQDLQAVRDADAVVVVASGRAGVGMYVELGAALLRAQQGEPIRVAVVGRGRDESVFFHHPAVTRHPSIDDWLAQAS